MYSEVYIYIYVCVCVYVSSLPFSLPFPPPPQRSECCLGLKNYLNALGDLDFAIYFENEENNGKSKGVDLLMR